MKTLPNGVTVFNGAPHQITFWKPGWKDVVNVESDGIISAEICEQAVYSTLEGVTLVKTRYKPTPDGDKIVAEALDEADVIVGSIIAAQAYPGVVFGGVAAPGYERVAEKRILPDKFVVF